MSTIDNNRTFKEFRERCEDKNTLNNKGSLYVGTGSQKKLSNGALIYETGAITPPTSNSEVLTKNNNATGGLSWTLIAEVLSVATTEGQNTYVKDSNNVKATINGKNINDIFENNGTTVKNAKLAERADFTDFTNAPWFDVIFADTGETSLVEGATYEVVPYEIDSAISTKKNARCHGFITYDPEFSSYTANGSVGTNAIVSQLYSYISATDNGLRIVHIYLFINNQTMKVRKYESFITNSGGIWSQSTPTETDLRFKYRRIR